MKTIYHIFLCEDFGEIDAFFEVINNKLVLIHWWDCNDAHYRDEYMGTLFNHVGVNIEHLPEKYTAKAIKTLKEQC